MSNNYWEDEDDDMVDDTPKSETQLIKDMRKRERQKDKRIQELEEKVATFDKIARESSIKSILEKKGVPAKASNLILKDLDGDVSEEAVSKWLDTYADVLNIKVDPEGSGTPQVSDSNRSALAEQDEFTQGAKTPNSVTESFESKLDSITDEEEFWRFVHSNGKTS